MGAKHKGKGNRLYRCIAQCMPAPRTPGEASGESDLGTRMHSAQNRSGDETYRYTPLMTPLTLLCYVREV